MDEQPGGIRWPLSRQKTMFAAAMSLFIHLVLLFALGFMFISPPVKGSVTPRPSSSAAVVSQSELEEGVLSELASEVPSVEVDPSQLAMSDASLDSPAEDLFPTTGSDFDVGTGAGDGGDGEFETTGTAAGGSASFFGVEARGNRFAIIADVSGSMRGERITTLREELAEAVNGLHDKARFTVILYHSDAVEITGPSWLRATRSNKRMSIARINGITPGGGTVPRTAFEALFNRDPSADVVWFMTDGAFGNDSQTMEVAREILRMRTRASSGCVIHTITFYEHTSADAMQLIANQTGGEYHQVGGTP